MRIDDVQSNHGTTAHDRQARRRSAAQRRCSAAMLAVLVAAALIAAAAPAAAQKAPKFKKNDACTLLTDRKVEKALDQPIAGRSYFFGKLTCDYTLGDAAAPAAVFSAAQLYPSLFDTPGARHDFEDQLAVERLSDDQISEVYKLGEQAYVNRTKGKVSVLANKKYAFELAWKPNPAGTAITSADVKALKKLAKQAQARIDQAS
jgi:hypothetical protein